MIDRFAPLSVRYLEQLGVLEAGSHLESALHFFIMDVTKH